MNVWVLGFCQATGTGPGMGIPPVPGDDSIISWLPYPLAPTPYPLAPTPYPLAPPHNSCHILWLWNKILWLWLQDDRMTLRWLQDDFRNTCSLISNMCQVSYHYTSYHVLFKEELKVSQSLKRCLYQLSSCLKLKYCVLLFLNSFCVCS